MAYKIDFTPKAAVQFSKLDNSVKKRVKTVLERIQELQQPRFSGKALQGPLAGLWRYRAGDYRIIAKIDDGKLIVLVIDVDHRSSIYK